jgi:glycosyltransferase involved in cell wall biosynthesis
MSTLLTVCIPTYNRCEFLGRAIRSVINQTFDKNKYEIIVVDDGSNDRTDIILKTFENDITIIKNKKNLGLSKSLNKAILKAKGKYFLRLDSDDYVNQEYINFLYTTLDQNKDLYDAVKCDYFIINDREIIVRRCNSDIDPIGCGIIFKVDDLLRVGMYSPKKKIFEEIDLMDRLTKNKNFKIFRLPIPLYRYKMHKSNMTGKYKKR